MADFGEYYNTLTKHFGWEESDKQYVDFAKKAKDDGITAKQLVAAIYYNMPDYDTFRNHEKSYKKAGYSSGSPGIACKQLFSRPRVRKVLKKIVKLLGTEVYDELYLRREMLDQYELAKGDRRYKDALSLLDKMNKSLGIYEADNSGAEDEIAKSKRAAQKAFEKNASFFKSTLSKEEEKLKKLG